MTKGYWYIVYGPERFLREAARSVTSLRKVDSTAHVSLLVDREPGDVRELFDFVEVDEKLHPKTKAEGLVDNMFEGKLYNLHRAPYDSTFCIDTDTYFYEDCSDLFNLTKWFDLAVCQSDGERTVYWPHKPYAQMKGFNVYTNGVMVFRRSRAMLKVFAKSAQYYIRNRALYRYKGTNCHTSAAIAEHPDLKVYTLPINYNARVRGQLALTGRVKIAHSSSGKTKMTTEEFEAVRKKINASTKYRVWNPNVE